MWSNDAENPVVIKGINDIVKAEKKFYWVLLN